MGSHDLARINRISYDTVLEKGQTIIVYEVADPARSKRADEQWHKTPKARRGKVSTVRAQHTASSAQEPRDADAKITKTTAAASEDDDGDEGGPVIKPQQVEQNREQP